MRFFIQTQYTLRALGFELVNVLFHRWSKAEARKPVLRRSRWIALSRCAIHFLPSSVFLFLIPRNINCMYLGPDFFDPTSVGFYQVLFQITAKLLEILCVASLTTIVLHALRHDLMRAGVPLAFVGSGVFFSQANFFWGPEMFAGALYSVKSWQRLRLLILIIVAGALALLIAPSSAVLLQPQSQTVRAGGTMYFLPAAPDVLWPSEISGSDELLECLGDYSPHNIVCASAGLESLRSYFQNFNTSFFLPKMMCGNHGHQPFVVQRLGAVIPHLLNSGSIGGLDVARETSISQPNAITATFQDGLIGDWRKAADAWSGSRLTSTSQYRYAEQRLSSVVSTSPVIFPRCSRAQNVTAGQSQVVFFPVKSWTNRKVYVTEKGSPEWEDNERPHITTMLTRNLSELIQHEWVELPIDQFGPVSGGIILHLPGSDSKTSYALVACSISAFWYSSEIYADSLRYEAAWSVPNTDVGVEGWGPIRNDLNASNAEANNHRRLITIRDKWFQSLSPRTACASRGNESTQFTTTLDCLFSDVGLSTVLEDMRTLGQPIWDGKTCNHQPPDPAATDVDRFNRVDCDNGYKHQLIEMILGSVFANGLSRYGSRYAFDSSSVEKSKHDPSRWVRKVLPKAPDYSDSLLSNKPHHNAILSASAGSDHVDLRMDVHVVGFAWCARGFSGYLAIAVVLIYMLLALVHTVWVLKTGVTSSSWDTVTELLALALNSPRPDALKGSGAGIERMGTYRRMVRLRVQGEKENERVVMVIDGEEQSGRNIEIDGKYL